MASTSDAWGRFDHDGVILAGLTGKAWTFVQHGLTPNRRILGS
jgi:hypothetical protein